MVTTAGSFPVAWLVNYSDLVTLIITQGKLFKLWPYNLANINTSCISAIKKIEDSIVDESAIMTEIFQLENIDKLGN